LSTLGRLEIIGLYAKRYGLNPYCPHTLGALESYLLGKRLGVKELQYLAVGASTNVPIYDSITGKPRGSVRSIDLSFAATKPMLVPVKALADDLETHYRQNAGRGSGPKAELITAALEQARLRIGNFVGANPEEHVTIFTSNTSVGMNKLVRIALADPKSVFIASLAGHHSAQLPPRQSGHSKFFRLNPDGTYDLNSMEAKLKKPGRGKHPVLLIESQSNVTGYTFPVAEIAELAARYNTILFIDHAQGAASMPIDLSTLPGRVLLAMSGHKVYSRDGSGGIVGPKDFFEGVADEPAGGTISAVTDRDIFFSLPPHNQEAGTPAFIAQISFGKAVDILTKAGLEDIREAEGFLSRFVLAELQKVDGVEILGDITIPRGPVISFSLTGHDGKKIPPGFVGAALQYFWGMDTRVGQFCAHPYVYFLQGVGHREARKHARLHAERQRAGCAALPGDEKYHAARFSFGFPTKRADLARLPEIIRQIRDLWPDKSILELDHEAGEFYVPGQPRGSTQIPFDLCQDGPLKPISLPPEENE